MYAHVLTRDCWMSEVLFVILHFGNIVLGLLRMDTSRHFTQIWSLSRLTLSTIILCSQQGPQTPSPRTPRPYWHFYLLSDLHIVHVLTHICWMSEVLFMILHFGKIYPKHIQLYFVANKVPKNLVPTLLGPIGTSTSVFTMSWPQCKCIQTQGASMPCMWKAIAPAC